MEKQNLKPEKDICIRDFLKEDSNHKIIQFSQEKTEKSPKQMVFSIMDLYEPEKNFIIMDILITN